LRKQIVNYKLCNGNKKDAASIGAKTLRTKTKIIENPDFLLIKLFTTIKNHPVTGTLFA